MQKNNTHYRVYFYYIINMKTSSAKNKGRRLQQYVVDAILSKFKYLTDRDVRSTPMGVTGSDVTLSEQAFKLFPYSVECKNTEKLNIWQALKQNEQDTRAGKPILVFKRNRTDIYVAMKFEDFMNLL